VDDGWVGPSDQYPQVFEAARQFPECATKSWSLARLYPPE
jgi:hypothetical protein